MSTEAADVVAEMGKRFTAGDVEGAFALLHPEFRIEQPASLPHGGVHRGREGMAAMGALFARHWDRDIADPRVLGCGPEQAVQVTTQTWTAKETGRARTVDVVELFTVEGGRVREIRVFQQDTHALLGTLGDA
ncbi:ketosteroid isomerase-like protein [Actinocorallia herbida]|uniref:Ketosteroid isomerase-like protein n=1 Tax=Actinocorallia herbida TaxID=58109 RepID=A0A3N1CYQ0_9ACTN|nr:nuclear transport factor 2 family protein [Actinocorallia herbida]ROO85908.1 ketosteroid isomerase-like protein [Actinocorallia herbida]